MKNKQTKINYTDIWGLREEKYKYLEENDIFSTKWQSIKPQEPHNFFTIKDFKGVELYDQFVPLDKIFRQFNAGVATGKDDLLVSFDKEDLVRKLSIAEKSIFDISMQTYKMPQVLIDRLFEELKGSEIKDSIVSYSYRPFDTRYVIYSKRILQRARDIIMGSFLKPNLGLVSLKGVRKQSFGYFFVSDNITDRHILDTSADTAYVFPLHIYNESDQQGLLEEIHKSINLQWGNLGLLENPQGFTAEAIFYYIYAILYSNTYREKYQEFLKIEFPRIPLIKALDLFYRMSELGEQLVNLHLLKSPELEVPIAKFHGTNSNTVEKREYKEDRVFINDSQYFDNVTPEVWDYYIGGYQVLEKWLKDRKGRSLSAEDIKHYCRMVTALAKTIEIQKQIDGLYPKVEETLSK